MHALSCAAEALPPLQEQHWIPAFAGMTTERNTESVLVAIVLRRLTRLHSGFERRHSIESFFQPHIPVAFHFPQVLAVLVETVVGLQLETVAAVYLHFDRRTHAQVTAHRRVHRH